MRARGNRNMSVVAYPWPDSVWHLRWRTELEPCERAWRSVHRCNGARFQPRVAAWGVRWTDGCRDVSALVGAVANGVASS